MSEPALSFILDTSAVIELMQQGILAGPGSCYTFITLAELYMGARKSNNLVRETRRFERTLRASTILFATQETSGIYADLWTHLELVGRRIPSNDLWTAAIAIESALPLYARDEHFARVPGLRFVPVQ